MALSTIYGWKMYIFANEMEVLVNLVHVIAMCKHVYIHLKIFFRERFLFYKTMIFLFSKKLLKSLFHQSSISAFCNF